MIRERLVFDVCAAPFGTAYFFSCRFGEAPAVVQLWQLVVLVLASAFCAIVSFTIFFRIFGMLAAFIWPVALIMLIVPAIYLMRNAVALRLDDVDELLLKVPVINTMYEAWFRKETYYREDTRLMYRDTVNAAVKAKLEELTGAKGVKLIRYNEWSPILGEMYKARFVEPSQPKL